MSPKARHEYVLDMRRRYAAATSVERTALLDEVVAVTGYHRKYAITLLNGQPRPPKKRRRQARYGAEVAAALSEVWQAAGYPWSARLKAMLPLWMPWLEQRIALDSCMRSKLAAISTRSIDRLLTNKRGELRRHTATLTRSGPWLKHQIPIRAERWDVTHPGWLEIDLVAHCGNSNGGEFISSLNATDIATGWTETRAVMGKGQLGVVRALEEIRQALPFPLVGIDSDSGSEFININLVRWCQANKIHFTRSRPYKKNDNAHIEQKNWTHVRKIFGWLRFDDLEVLGMMNALYRTELRIWMNYFQPSVKLLEKIRVGSRTRKTYDAPQTPLDRLHLNNYIVQLQLERATVDPFALSRRITEGIGRIADHASKSSPPSKPVHGPTLRALSHRSARVERAAGKILTGATVTR